MKIRIVCNSFKLGGAERSMSTLATLLMNKGHDLVWHPTMHNDWGFEPPCAKGAPFRNANLDGDVLIYCVNNSTLGIRDPRRSQPAPDPDDWKVSGVRTRVMILNWEMGDAHLLAHIFHHVAFLSEVMRQAWILKTRRGLGSTWVHAPCVDIVPFLKVKPNYDAMVLARHSFPNKWPRNSLSILYDMKAKARQWKFHTMGMPYSSRIVDCAYQANEIPSDKFLEGASAYWYAVPSTYAEQGPRTVVEAMAAGIPCMVDNRDGPAERVICGTGWKIQRHEDYGTVLSSITSTELQDKGEKAREWARLAFNPFDWAGYIESLV